MKSSGGSFGRRTLEKIGSVEVCVYDLRQMVDSLNNMKVRERGSYMQKVEFEEDRCKGCKLCVAACPKKLIVLGTHLNTMGFHPAIVVDQDACISCAFCARMCPDTVITVRKEEKERG